jgi:diadenylate cyclase
MELQTFLSPQRCRILNGGTMDEAVRETLSAMFPERTERERNSIAELVFSREADASTIIAPGIAIPHAILDGDAKTEMAVAVSKTGVSWYPADEDNTIHIMVLLIGSRAAHLEALAKIVSILRDKNVYRNLVNAGSPEEVYGILLPADRTQRGLSERIIKYACGLRNDFPDSVVVIHADSMGDFSLLSEIPGGGGVIVVSSSEEALAALPSLPHIRPVAVPVPAFYSEKHQKFVLVYLHSHGYLQGYKRVINVAGGMEANRVDSIRVIDIEQDIGVFSGLRGLELPADIKRPVFARVLQLAESLAFEGREGKPVGAIFVLGDYAKVLTKSRQLIINPFKGYPRQQRSILDPVLDETIKEFAKIDGAFLISGDGVIESAGTFIAGQPESASHRPGLGSRHAAALGITAVTASIAVVISESTRKISVFQNGRHFELD